METKKILKTCKNGHKFYKGLENNGITTLEQLSKYTEKEILNFHGTGKTTILKLQKLLSENKLTFKNLKML